MARAWHACRIVPAHLSAAHRHRQSRNDTQHGPIDGVGVACPFSATHRQSRDSERARGEIRESTGVELCSVALQDPMQCLHVLPGIPVLLASPPGPAVEPASETAASCKSMPLLFSGGQMRSLVLTDYPKGAKSYHTTRIPELSLHRKVPGSVIWLLPTLGAQEPCREFECQVAFQKSTCVSLLFLQCSM